jgi:heme/copper-type cytochrome/quinol oxidase subunit 4
MSEDRDEDEPSGHGALIGVVFAIALTGLALWLVQQMRDSASLLNCVFTKDPKCRDLIQE